MIDFKLAQYNLETSKFEKFLEIGRDFGYFGHFIFVQYIGDGSIPYIQGGFEEFYGPCFLKDEKDPLNRFNGLFDGITYGNGRFVLIQGRDGDIIQQNIYGDNGQIFPRIYFILNGIPLRPDCYGTLQNYGEKILKNAIILGNIHQNPELYEKIK